MSDISYLTQTGPALVAAIIILFAIISAIRHFYSQIKFALKISIDFIIEKIKSSKDSAIKVFMICALFTTAIASFLDRFVELESKKAQQIIENMPTDFLRARAKEFRAPDNSTLSFWVIVLLPGIGAGFTYLGYSHYQKRTRSLEKKLGDEILRQESEPKIDIDDLFEIELKHLFEALKLPETARITIFRNEGVGDKFSCFARYCPDDEHRERKKYLYERIGIIRSTLKQNGNGFIKSNIPAPDNTESYMAAQLELGLTEEKIHKMNYKPRCYLGKIVTTHDRLEKIGMIVIEDTSPNTLSERTLTKLTTLGFQSKLSFLMDIAKEIRPTLAKMKSIQI